MRVFIIGTFPWLIAGTFIYFLLHFDGWGSGTFFLALAEGVVYAIACTSYNDDHRKEYEQKEREEEYAEQAAFDDQQEKEFNDRRNRAQQDIKNKSMMIIGTDDFIKKVKQYHIDHSHTPAEAAVFENCLDCLYYGYGLSCVNDLDLPEDDLERIWNEAHDFMGNIELRN